MQQGPPGYVPPTAIMAAPSPGGGGPPRETNTLAYVSLGAGLLSFCSVICCCIPFLNWGAPIAMFVCGMIAVITGVIARKKAEVLQHGQTEALVGIILGSIWMIGALVAFAVVAIGCAGLGILGAAAPR